MLRPGRRGRFVGFSALLLIGTSVETLSAAEGVSLRSPEAARQLATLMSSQKLDAVAAVDPETPDRFVAALLFPSVQLLVVAAQPSSPAVLRDEIAKKQYADVYANLHQASLPETKVFFQDLKADGLPGKPGEAIDVMYEQVVHQTLFDGDPAKHHISNTAYAEKLAAADAQYVKLLTALINQLKSTGGQQ